MAETQTNPNKSLKPLWWALTIVAFVALIAWAYIGTKKSNREVAAATAAGTTTGLAYDPSTGATVPAGATPGALGVGGPPPIVEPNGNSANGSAGGTIAGINPQATPAPGPLAQGAEVPPARLK
jgi:hypothetical protein